MVLLGFRVSVLFLRNSNGIVKLSLGKRKHTPPCSSAELFFAEKMGSTEERFRWWIWFSWFLQGFLYQPPTWKVFSLRTPNDFLSVVVVYAFFFSVSRSFLGTRTCTAPACKRTYHQTHNINVIRSCNRTLFAIMTNCTFNFLKKSFE